MSAKVIRKCLIFLADEDQFDDYIDFKSSLEEISRGTVEIKISKVSRKLVEEQMMKNWNVSSKKEMF